MSEFSIESMSTAELKALLEEIPGEIAKRQKTGKAVLLKALEETAKSHGFIITQIGLAPDNKEARQPRQMAPTKFRHPNEPMLHWSGRGRQPRWVADWLAAGNQLDQLRIK